MSTPIPPPPSPSGPNPGKPTKVGTWADAFLPIVIGLAIGAFIFYAITR